MSTLAPRGGFLQPLVFWLAGKMFVKKNREKFHAGVFLRMFWFWLVIHQNFNKIAIDFCVLEKLFETLYSFLVWNHLHFCAGRWCSLGHWPLAQKWRSKRVKQNHLTNCSCSYWSLWSSQDVWWTFGQFSLGLVTGSSLNLLVDHGETSSLSSLSGLVSVARALDQICDEDLKGDLLWVCRWMDMSRYKCGWWYIRIYI